MPKIANRTKQIQVFNVPCRIGCNGEGCLCTEVTIQLAAVDADGTRGVRVIDRRLPGSVTFLAGENREVPAFVASSPDVKRAIDRGALRLL